MTLENFPRGGKKTDITAGGSSFLSQRKEKEKGQRKVHKKSNNNIREATTLNADIAERLSIATLREGLVVLGRISDVTEYNLHISLPGGLTGLVQVTNIDATYTNFLQNIINLPDTLSNEFKPLPELYRKGEYVVCFAKSVTIDEKYKIDLSLEPHLINENVNNYYLKKGSRVICIVKSVEDHGYVVDTGIANTRAFIPIKNIDAGEQYFPGKQLSCIIKKIDTVDGTSIIKLSSKQNKIDVTNTDDIKHLDSLVPGTKLSLHVKRILSNGLEVSFSSNNIGYINQMYLDKELSHYEVDMDIVGTLLYILPTVKFAYFSLLVNRNKEKILSIGQIVQNATVLYREFNGIVLKLSSEHRGFVSMHRTGISYASIPDKFVYGTTHQCRVLAYNWMERTHVCTMQHDMIKQKHFAISNFAVGDIVKVKIVNINTDTNSVKVQVERIFGNVSAEQISDRGVSAIKDLKVDEYVDARVLHLDYERSIVHFTMKKSLLQSTLPILSRINDAQCGSKYHGTIIKIKPSGLLIKFYGDAKGWVPRSYLDSDRTNVKWTFYIGQTIIVCVKTIDKNTNRMTLQIVTENDDIKSQTFSIGEMLEGTITESSIEGVYLKIFKNDHETSGEIGFLPAGHMAPCAELGGLLASKCVPGDTMSALVFSTKPKLLLTRTIVTQEQCRDFNFLKKGDVIPCSVRDITEDGLGIILPILNYKVLDFIPYNKVSSFDSIYMHQILFVKVTMVNKKKNQLNLTMKLKKVWTDTSAEINKLTTAVDSLNLYFSKLSELADNPYYKNKPISSVKLGERVVGVVEKITDHGLVLKLENNLYGIVPKEHYTGFPKVGETVSGSILWINFIHELITVTLLPTIMNSVSTKQNKLPNLPSEKCLRGEILMITSWFILVVLKGQGKSSLAALPARRHINDVQPDLSPYVIGSRLRCYVVLNREESNIVPICMVKSAFEVPRKDIVISPAVSLKRKLKPSTKNDAPAANKKKKRNDTDKISNIENEEGGSGIIHTKTATDTKRNVKNDSIVLNNAVNKQTPQQASQKNSTNTSRKILRTTDSNHVNSQKKNENLQSSKVTKPKTKSKHSKQDAQDTEKQHMGMPECGFFWDSKSHINVNDSSESSTDSEEDDQQPRQKKKRLTAAERREQERQKEREIREREEALANNEIPNSVDQFDRLILSSPNSSLLWLQYMAYHLQATEIEKARVIARRAIKTINFREENEKLNVWSAWLNLESRFGTPESLHDVFVEAVKANDALKIYTHMLTVHADAGRQVEAEKLVNSIIAKFRDIPDIWINCGTVLLKMGLKDRSRQIMQRALQSLPPSCHINLMVQFAQLENKFGDKERSQTLFEQILSSYPKRVDVWASYVDALVKSNDVDIARKVLERAIVQTLPARKMKTLFKKFISFEEQHGSMEGVARVQQLAAEYVEKQCQNE